jgi:hypothetical protein
MTTPAQDRDQRAALSAPRAVGRAVVVEPDPLRVAAREALRLLRAASHSADPSEWDDSEVCVVCSEPWPCEVEAARRVLADALEDR